MEAGVQLPENCTVAARLSPPQTSVVGIPSLALTTGHSSCL